MIIVVIECLLMLTANATKDMVDAMWDVSKFLPLNDGNHALDYLMGQNYNQLQSDLKKIKEKDPLYEVIPKNERTTESGKRKKADLAKLLIKFDAIIKQHLVESKEICAGEVKTGPYLFFIIMQLSLEYPIYVLL